MNSSLPSRSTPKSTDDWLNECSFQTRQDTVVPGLLNHKIDRSAPAAEDPALLGLFPLAGNYPPAPAKAAETPRNPEDSRRVAAEVHNFSKLATGVCAPANGRDSLPEYILFGAIALLAMGWPIWAMLRTWMTHH